MAEINRAMAEMLWKQVSLNVDRFHPKIVAHEKSTFLGYADVTIELPNLPGFKLKLRGIEAKVLKGNPHLDMPTEKGADGKFYPRYFPLSGELRAVMTTKLFQHQDVASALEAAKNAAQQSGTAGLEAGASTDNPFAG